MFYIRGNCGKKIDVDDLTIYNTCPGCEQETVVDSFWDIFSVRDFSLYDVRVYCPTCARRVRKSGRAVQM